jgi:hypothetical protein
MMIDSDKDNIPADCRPTKFNVVSTPGQLLATITRLLVDSQLSAEACGSHAQKSLGR